MLLETVRSWVLTMELDLAVLSEFSKSTILQAGSSGKFSFSRIESYRGSAVPWATIIVGMPGPWFWEMLTERS